MQVLIDESLPRDLKRHLPEHQVTTVPERGWASKSNGELLRLASSEFDVFLTADQNLEFQQNMSDYDIAIVVLVAPSNRLSDLVPLAPRILEVLQSVEPGSLVRVAA